MLERSFKAKKIPRFSNKLVLGTSRTKYVNPASVKSSVHSYRGATLTDLYKVVSSYTCKKLQSVTIIAGFNDHRLHTSEVTAAWYNLITLVFRKFNPDILIVPKTIASANNHRINRKIFEFNHQLNNLLNTHFFNAPIYSPGFYISVNFFCKDGIHFSFAGNEAFTRVLAQIVSAF